MIDLLFVSQTADQSSEKFEMAGCLDVLIMNSNHSMIYGVYCKGGMKQLVRECSSHWITEEVLRVSIYSQK